MKSLTGRTTRPTTDKIKGAIFNMLGQSFAGGRVLDLYAGSGALAIEAVSRGCEEAYLVEQNRAARAVIEANIAMTGEDSKFNLLKMPAAAALSNLTGPFDLIFLDPPYAEEQMVRDIERLQQGQLLSDLTRIVCETEKSAELPETIGDLTIWKQKVYGITKITIYA